MADSDRRKAERADRAPWHAREIERPDRAEAGRPLSPIMKTAVTARDLARSQAERSRQ